MAISPTAAPRGKSPARRTEPTFGLPALWIDEVHRVNWRRRWATRWWIRVQWWQRTLTHLITTHTEELFGRQEARQLLIRSPNIHRNWWKI